MYLKALPLRGVEDIEKIKDDVSKNTIVIVRVTPLAERNVEELRKAVEELYRHVEKKGGDIARLGEERIVVTPPAVKIWRGLY
ncbi:MAG: cell division protein SepF [Thaumarchaeota archaeon]|nr:cell division protein SepF [Nitrososphaerota archaeon]